MPSAADHARARREIVASCVMFAAALTVLVLTMRATFTSMWFFPHVFGVIVAVLAIVSLLAARNVAWKPRLALAFAIIGVAALTPGFQTRAFFMKMERYEREASAALEGRPAPAIPFVRALGTGEPSAGSLQPRGKITLVNFWATWCDPCVEEIPMLERFWQEHRGSGVEVIGVTRLYDDSGPDAEIDRIRAFLDRHRVTYPVVVGAEDSPAHSAYGVDSLPASVLVDRDGTVITFGAGVRGTIRLIRLAEELAAAG